MKDNTFVTIQSWMRTELNLSGTKLMTYAIIFGFSQDGESRFTGSRTYLAEWCGCTVRSIQTILNELVEDRLITKYEYTHNGIKNCEYAVNFTPSEKISPPPGEKISPYNIDTNKIENISKDIPKPTNSFLGSAKPKAKEKKLSLYDKCQKEIMQFTDNPELQECLTEYLTIRLAMKDKPMYGVNQWIGMLNKLKDMQNQIAGVRTSTERGWASFFAGGTNTFGDKRDVFSEYGAVKSDKGKDSEFCGSF